MIVDSVRQNSTVIFLYTYHDTLYCKIERKMVHCVDFGAKGFAQAPQRQDSSTVPNAIKCGRERSVFFPAPAISPLLLGHQLHPSIANSPSVGIGYILTVQPSLTASNI